jgi:hypothetical protein
MLKQKEINVVIILRAGTIEEPTAGYIELPCHLFNLIANIYTPSVLKYKMF